MTTIIQAKSCIYMMAMSCAEYRCCRARCLFAISINEQPLYNNRFLTLHKSCNVAVFCYWGEVVVSREPLARQIIRKTAKFCIMMRAEPEHCDYWLKSFLRDLHLNSKYFLFCLYLFSLNFVLEMSSMLYYLFLYRRVID